MPPFLPEAWNIYTVNLEPRVGSKPGKQRPCLSIQPSFFAQSGLSSTVIVPLTTKIIDPIAWPLRVRIEAGFCGLTKDSDLLIDQILAWDNSLFVSHIGELPEVLIKKTKLAIIEFLDLTLK